MVKSSYSTTDFNNVRRRCETTKFGRVQTAINSALEGTRQQAQSISTRNRKDSRKMTRSGHSRSNFKQVTMKKVDGANASKGSKIYVYNQWYDDQDITPPEKNTFELHNVRGYTIVDSEETNDLVVTDGDNGSFIAAKLSKRRCQSELNNKNGYMKKLRKCLPRILKSKPNVQRGKKNGGTSTHYACFGHRKDPLQSGVTGEYSFNSNVNETEQAQHLTTIVDLVERIERAAMPIINQLPEYKPFKETQKKVTAPTMVKGGVATQFSIGLNYWSGAHYDNDYFFSILSCLTKTYNQHDEMIYYFCWPEYQLAMPLRSGDIIIFNPLKLHSCTNCKYQDSYIFSCYVSEKTMMTSGIGTLDIK